MDNVKEQLVAQSEFKTLLERFTRAVDNSSELSVRAYSLSNSLLDFKEKPICEDVIEKDPRGVVEMLYKQIYRLEHANNRLQETVTHLDNVIGY